MTHVSSASRPGGFFGVAFRWETWAALFYLLLSFPIALAGWVALVTLLATGGGLAITVVGVPMLILTVYLWCWYAELERLLANTLLRTGIRPMPFAGEAEAGNLWQRIKARLRNRYTWRAFAFAMFVRFPAALAGFCLVGVTIIWSVELMATPIAVAAGGSHSWLSWQVDTWADAAIAAPVGLLLLIPSLHAIRFGGWLSGKLITALLQSPETPGGPTETKLDRAATAAVTWPGVLGGTRAQREGSWSIQVRVWAAHFALYAFVMALLLVINALTTPGTWWVLWPAWGWGMAIALHTGYLLWGHLGGHFFAFAATNAGLVIIDSNYAGSTWFFWPLLGWAIALAAHIYVVFGFTRVEAEPLLEYHQPEAAPPGPDPVRTTGAPLSDQPR